ncbi:MAG: redoxin domain-containing protein [Deltaproteobacteria bacterium]|nr:redoxin domain-containing protein [Deltaproteobacteria bacterium]
MVSCSCLLAVAFPLAEPSHALRGLSVGAKVPDLPFTGISGEGGKLSSFLGEKGAIIIFWATWSSRSPEILAFAEQKLRGYEKHGMKILAVNVDHQAMGPEGIALVKAKARELEITYPVVLDEGLTGYNEIGIISTPTTLIIDNTLKLVDVYPGFPSVARNDIPDRIDAFLGIVKEKRPEKTQYLLEHTPKNRALYYYNLGKRLFLIARSPSGGLKAVPETAIERLDEAIRRDPDYFRPYLLKAIIFDMAKAGQRKDAVLQELRKKDVREVYERRTLGYGYLYLGEDSLAEESFSLLAAQVPDDPGVLFGQAVLAARKGEGQKARRALDAISRNPRAGEELGFDPVELFTPDGSIKTGTQGTLRSALERLLEIVKEGLGGIRPDAPVRPADEQPR